MANHERGRSPSAGQGSHLNTHRSTSASPHPALDSTSYHPSLPPYNNGVLGAQTSSIAFGDPSFTRPENYLLGQQQTLGGDQTFLSSQGFGAQSANTANSFGYLQSGAEQISPTTNTGSSAFPAFDFNSTTVDYSQDTSLDPSLLEHLDLQSQTTTGVPMAAPMQPPSPTPPHMLQPEMARRQSNSPSPSPNYQQQQGGFTRPRNTSESLEVPGAMYSHGQHPQAEWGNMGGYRGHYRTPSDQISDYSSQGHYSNQASPNMPTYDSFEGAHSSPLINAQQDPVINEGLGFQRFSLSEQSQPQQQAYQHSPGHSPRISPQLLPQQQISQQQQALPLFTAQDGYGMNANNQFGVQPNQAGLEMFPPLSKPQSPSDFGAADQMSPPEISVEFAPPMAGSLGVNVPAVKVEEQEGLSPPARTPSRNRRRAVSESFAGSSRPTSPALGGRGRSPSLQPYTADNFSHSSRSPSPARGRDKSGNRVRSTSHASDQRDYILNLAEPERTPSNGATGRESNSGRVQKHPATFQCTLCPKRFTRAYNLRSHLRTHTDERPFVCTVCGKAFARQHDRKRHEGLHSGEKKFVCKGTLTSGLPWGCGRRFARADALGRHFRSEAGRVCIKPLLEEERVERERAWMEEQQAAQVAQGLVAPQPMMGHPQMGMDNNFLPAALLQQYPALQNIDWSQVPPPGAGQPGDDGEIGDYSDGGMGRSSFEHSSGGEYNDYDVSENEMEMGGMQQPYGGAVGQAMHPGMSMQAHAGAGQQGYYGGAGGYLEDFEGR